MFLVTLLASLGCLRLINASPLSDKGSFDLTTIDNVKDVIELCPNRDCLQIKAAHDYFLSCLYDGVSLRFIDDDGTVLLAIVWPPPTPLHYWTDAGRTSNIIQLEVTWTRSNADAMVEHGIRALVNYLFDPAFSSPVITTVVFPKSTDNLTMAYTSKLSVGRITCPASADPKPGRGPHPDIHNRPETGPRPFDLLFYCLVIVSSPLCVLAGALGFYDPCKETIYTKALSGILILTLMMYGFLLRVLPPATPPFLKRQSMIVRSIGEWLSDDLKVFCYALTIQYMMDTVKDKRRRERENRVSRATDEKTELQDVCNRPAENSRDLLGE
ncbi:MAG: hypothetical protein Q9181_005126 [Wetmoreana brouardii]